MAKYIDLSARLDDSRPYIIVAPGEQYEINDDKNNVIKMNAEIKKAKSELEGMEIALSMLIGESALSEIESKHPGMTSRLSSITQLFLGASAAISGGNIEDIEARFLAQVRKQ